MTPRNFPRTVSVLAAAAALLGLVFATPTGAAPNKKLATVSPSFLAGDPPSQASLPLATRSDFTFLFTLTNVSTSPQSFGSAMITVPAGFVVGEPTITDATAWPDFSVTRVDDSTAGPLLLTSVTNAGVPTNEPLTISVPVTTPAQACDTTWTTEIKQSNDFSGLPGNDFVISGAQPTSPLQGGIHLVWDPAHQPSDVQHDVVMQPDPVVDVEDACNRIVTTYDGRTITATDYTAGTATPTTFQATAEAGVATFTNISYSVWGSDHYLVATGDSPAPGTCDQTTACKSSTFHVYEVLKICGASACSSGTQSGPLDETLAEIDAVSGSAGDTMRMDIGGDPNTNLGNGSEFDPCSTSSGRDIAYGEIVKFDVDNRSKTVTMTLPKQYVNEISNNGTPFMDICLVLPANSPDAFFDKFHYTNPQPTDVPVTTGLLPDCASTANDPPCVLQRQKRAANEIITFQLDPGDPHASWF